MGNIKIIMKFHFYILLALILPSCSQNKLDISKSNQDYHLTKKIINSEESVNFIETSQEFELKHNEIFQQDLQTKSKEYYDTVIDSFVDEETGSLKLLEELWDRSFKSENERKILWKLKIEQYFRTTAFLTHIRNEVTIYTDGVNNQRKNGISKILGTKHSSDLNLPIIRANSFNAKNENIEKIIRKINDEINDQLADVALGIIPEIIALLLYFCGIWKTKSLGCLPSIIITIVLAIFFIWRSHVRQNEMKKILKTECYNTLNSTKIDYLDQLNKNTIDYYSQLKKINYEANK